MKSRLGNAVTRCRRTRVLATSVVALAALTGTTACGDSAGPEAGEVTTQEMRDIEDRLDEVDARVASLEEWSALTPEDIDDMAHGDQSLLGERVTVSAAVSDLFMESDSGTAFRIGGDEASPIAVISLNPPQGLDVEDVVRVTATVTSIDPPSFEADFGVAANEFFDDPDAFFEEAQGQLAIKADQIDLLDDDALG